MSRARLWPWLVRGTWAAVPLAAGPGYAALLDERSATIRATGSVGLWAAWATALVATLAPFPPGLTVLRVVAPAGAALSTAAAVAGESGAAGGLWWVPVLAVAFAPATGRWFVNGSAYPNEERFPLRVPGLLALGPVPVAWAVTVGGPATGVLLLAAGRWAAGIAALVILVPVALVLVRALHGLSRRWVVFVPAGVVVHDSLSLLDPVLFQRRAVRSLGPAPAETGALDLTQRAVGLALELVLADEVPLVLTRPGRRSGETVRTKALLFTPTRPGAVLEEARRRGLSEGSSSRA